MNEVKINLNNDKVAIDMDLECKQVATAVPVPPHGRLIDADTCEDYFYEHLSDAGMAGAMNAINEMPTIIPAEEA